MPTIECALARLIVGGEILLSDIWVYSRGIEETVDTILMRSQLAPQLAHLQTEMDRLHALIRLGEAASEYEAGHLLPCASVAREADLVIRNLHYTRGTSQVWVNELAFKVGRTYAVTGARVSSFP
jgi:hypothetical protein